MRRRWLLRGLDTHWRRGCCLAAFGLARLLGPLVTRQRSDHHVDAAANQLGLEIGMAVRGNVGQELLDDLEAKLRMRHFPAAELERDLDLHVLAEEADGVLEFYAQVMRINLRAELHLFDPVGMLVLPGFLLALGLLVAELAVVHQPAYGGRGVRGDFDQVHAIGASLREGLAQGQDPKLFAVGPDDPDLAGTDFPVNPDERTGR